MHEPLDPQGPTFYPQMTVEHRTRLVVVEIPVVGSPERIGRARPEIPQHPQQDDARRRYPDEHGNREVATPDPEQDVVRRHRRRLDRHLQLRLGGEGHRVRHCSSAPGYD